MKEEAGKPRARPTSWSEVGRLAEEERRGKEVPKPYTVPEGYRAPTLGEQWLYVSRPPSHALSLGLGLSGPTFTRVLSRRQKPAAACSAPTTWCTIKGPLSARL